MKKTTLSIWFIIISAAYAVYLHLISPSEIPKQIPTQIPSAAKNTASYSPLSTTTESNPAPVSSVPNNTSNTQPPAPVPVPVPKPKPTGMYSDGTYTGAQADAYYGTVQVRATIQSGRITGVDFLQYPSDRRTSQNISNYAMPILKSEAIQAQGANVDIVSGATDTSNAFQQSLGDALAQAKP